MANPCLEFGLEVGHAVGAIEGLVVPEEGEDGVGLEVGEPLVGVGEESLAVVGVEFRVELLGAGEGPLGDAGGMGTETRGIAGPSHVADDELVVGVAEVQLGFEAAEVHVAFGEPVAEEDDAFAGGGVCDALGACGRCGRGECVGGVRMIVGGGLRGEG